MKSYTDLSQSKKLAEILPLESADMYYFVADSLEKQEVNYTIRCGTPIVKTDIPCWSLAALLNVLPDIQGSNADISLGYNSIAYIHKSLYTKADNLVDCCYYMILKLHVLKLL